ncbi:MAG TPA: amidase domain-containing protein [Symbiobacteriaceae bacterium]|nr:amidase domain-containing protein [Symbiobacteriaceae bacterium]
MGRKLLIWLLLVVVGLPCLSGVRASAAPQGSRPDLDGRLQEIFRDRAKWLLTEGTPPPLEADYLPGSARAKWAIHHERGKIRYVRLWAEGRRVKFVEAEPSLYIKYLGGDEERARFYVGQTLALGYVYPGEPAVNKFGVGSRHVLELRRQGEKWLVASEWYSDPLGDDTETPDTLPAGEVERLPVPAQETALWRKGYDRRGAIAYADKYCGLAWGCGNDHRYNTRYRNYTGDGGDCTNFLNQILRDGGGLRGVPKNLIRVSNMAGFLQGTGRGYLSARGPFQAVWKRAAKDPRGFQSIVGSADLVAFQLKGKMEHFAVITGFDTHGYPLVNSHTADRYHVPFDLGWDRKTIYWFFRVAG